MDRRAEDVLAKPATQKRICLPISRDVLDVLRFELSFLEQGG
jgi:hypothetical protein